MSIVEQARQFAIEAHGDQKYGGQDSLPYSYHLQAVHDIIVEFHNPHREAHELGTYVLQTAAWLHDVIEDTPVTFEEIFSEFGRNIARLVFAVTKFDEDFEGEKILRKESNFYTYPKIRAAGREALSLKLADRIANVRHGIQHNHSTLGMYKKEYKQFRKYLRMPGELKSKWAELDKLHSHFVEGEK